VKAFLAVWKLEQAMSRLKLFRMLTPSMTSSYFLSVAIHNNALSPLQQQMPPRASIPTYGEEGLFVTRHLISKLVGGRGEGIQDSLMDFFVEDVQERKQGRS
jgi:hypothetical protein